MDIVPYPSDSSASILRGKRGLDCPPYRHLVRKRNCKSNIWEFFGHPADDDMRILDEGIGVCKLCGYPTSCKLGTTSNLRSHLKIYHPQEYLMLMAGNAEVSEVPSLVAVEHPNTYPVKVEALVEICEEEFHPMESSPMIESTTGHETEVLQIIPLNPLSPENSESNSTHSNKRKKEKRKREEASDESDRMFLLSLLPMVVGLSKRNKLDFKIKLMQLLQSYEQHGDSD